MITRPAARAAGRHCHTNHRTYEIVAAGSENDNARKQFIRVALFFSLMA
jgi:hypothetical protein